MKIKIFAVAVLALTVGFTVFNTFLLQKQLSELTEAAMALNVSRDNPNAIEEASSLREDFDKKKSFIGLTVNHNDLANIEVAFTDIIGELSVGEYNNAEVAKSRLIDALSHMRRLSGCNIEAII